MKHLINDVAGQMLCGNMLEEPIDKTAENIVKTVSSACAHVAESIYVDCSPEEQATVDMVQRLISEAILRKYG